MAKKEEKPERTYKPKPTREIPAKVRGQIKFACCDGRVLKPIEKVGTYVRPFRYEERTKTLYCYKRISHFHLIRFRDRVKRIVWYSNGIDSSAFKDFKEIEELRANSRLNYIGNSIFYGCNEVNVYYTGTKFMWESIRKEANWTEGCGKIYVHCKNGDIEYINS